MIPTLSGLFQFNVLKNVFFALYDNMGFFCASLFFYLVLLYNCAWIAMTGFSQLFKKETKYIDNEDYSDEEPFCNSTFQCVLFFWSHGFFDSGTSEMTDLLSWRKDFLSEILNLFKMLNRIHIIGK